MRMPLLPRDDRVAFAIYLVMLIAYCAVAGPRLLRPSSDIHFSHQAKMWLERRLDLGAPAPPSSNDWAEVETLTLKDGRVLKGTFLRSLPGRFRTLKGAIEPVTDDQIAKREKKFYVSFPPFPAVLFLPFVALVGLRFNDVAFTAILAAAGPALLYLVLRRLRARGDSDRTEEEDLWLTALFGLGTVYFYASVQGAVWYTAHVVATALLGLFLLTAMDARQPILAGLLLGGIVLTRPQMGLWGIFFLYELRRSGRPVIPTMLKVGLPVALLGAAGAAFNWARFGALAEFGHFYLNVRWTDRIQRYGLFNYAFLSRNLAAAFTLTPKLLAKKPFVQIPWHGLSMLITTPALGALLWPRRRGPLHAALWTTLAPIALMSFLYQNDGWVQFGFRFSIDYLMGLVVLLAIGGRPLTRPMKGLILIGVAVNLFGAITFGRMWQFYTDTFFPISPSEY